MDCGRAGSTLATTVSSGAFARCAHTTHALVPGLRRDGPAHGQAQSQRLLSLQRLAHLPAADRPLGKRGARSCAFVLAMAAFFGRESQPCVCVCVWSGPTSGLQSPSSSSRPSCLTCTDARAAQPCRSLPAPLPRPPPFPSSCKHLSENFANEGAAFIKKNAAASKPFFLYLGFAHQHGKG